MKLVISASPHIDSGATTRKIMGDVLIALCPALIAAIVIFGWRALLVTAVCAAACVFFEWGFEKLCHKPSTIGDLSAVVTGVILAYNLPVSIPLWQAVFGCLVAIVAVKQLFGGIGKNFANPALVGRIVLFLSFSKTMTAWVFPDAVSSATPLAQLAAGQKPELLTLLLGNHGGCIGETCALALLLGGAYLLVRGVITWQTPVCFVGTVFVLSLVLGQDALAGSLGRPASGRVLHGNRLCDRPADLLGPGAVWHRRRTSDLPDPLLRKLRRGRVVRHPLYEHSHAVSVQMDAEQAAGRCEGMKNTKEIRKSIVVLVVICLLTSAALAVVNHFTAPVSKANAEARAEQARLDAVPDAASFAPVEAVLPEEVVSAYTALDASGSPMSYLFTVEGKGFGGTIQVLCVIGTDGLIRTCRTMDVSSETTTLGGQTASERYTGQYTGQDASLSGVSAISHATITSNAYRGCVETAFEAYAIVKGAQK